MTIIQATKSLAKLITYNMKVIFGGKFIWFLLTALVLFCYFIFQSAWNGTLPDEGVIYNELFFPAILLIFYPAVYGIQNDAENRILEILFGIPNYMYKVWMFRLIVIYVEIYFILVFYSYLAHYLFYPANPFEMAFQMMFPVLFMGNMFFYFSTLTRNGNATAVIAIVISIVIVFISGMYGSSFWNVLLNPFNVPDNVHPAIWNITYQDNRLFLIIGSVIFMMLGLMNLQKREKFI